MTNDSTGRNSRPAAPMGSTVAVVVTAVALILGFLILRKINSDSSASGSSAGTTQPSASSVASSSSIADTTTTTINLASTKVQVANASGISGVAKRFTLELAGKGYDTATATTATLNPKLDTSRIIYNANDPNAEGVANELAKLFGGIAVEAKAEPVPTKSGSWAAGSAVIVLIGKDIANKTLAQIAADSGTATANSTATNSSVATAST